MKINPKSFFNYFIIHPFSKKLSSSDRAIATLGSGVLLILTLGILHGRAYLKGRKFKVHTPNGAQPSIPSRIAPPRDPVVPGQEKPKPIIPVPEQPKPVIPVQEQPKPVQGQPKPVQEIPAPLNPVPQNNSYDDCTDLDKRLAEINDAITTGDANLSSIKKDLAEIRQKLEGILFEAKELKAQNKDTRNLSARAERVRENIETTEGLFKALYDDSSVVNVQTTQSVPKPLNTDQFLAHIKPKAGAKSEGGKEIQKIVPFTQWLDNEYQNKESPTYKAYQAIKIDNKALLFGIRGDGDCGFRAMIVSLLLELAKDPQCESKFNILMKNLDQVINETSTSIPGFEKLNKQCLQELKNCNGDPLKLAAFLNRDDLVNQLTHIFRFLSNSICKHDLDQDKFPEDIKPQLEYGEGAQDLGTNEFLKRHATIDVENTKNMPAYLFAGVLQILVLANHLGLGYEINKINEGQQRPEEPNKNIPQNSLLTLNLLCRDTRHFDVIFNTNR